MENSEIMDRISRLRAAMKAEKIDYYMVPTADFHGSEYVNDYFKVREFFSGFTGSSGTLLVWQEGAGLWTDGRYFVQAKQELRGTGITLFRMLDEGVPSLEEFLESRMEAGQVFGFDGRVVFLSQGEKYRKLEKKGVKIVCGKDLAEGIWQERPAFPAGEITVLGDALCGRSVEEKLLDVRAGLEKEGADGAFLTKLDDLMWLFNIRGCDVECNPVAMSYAYIGRKEAVAFLQESAVSLSVRRHFEKCGVAVREYREAMAYLEGIPEGQKILVDPDYCSYAAGKLLEKGHVLLKKKNPTELLKAVKNKTELANMRKVFLLDSVAVTKFIYWLKKNIGKKEITEVSAAGHLDALRSEIPGFLGLSFPTIAAYNENAAMMHYRAVECAADQKEGGSGKNARLRPEGMLLVDSGGQYLGGTTDVTRTIVLGPISDEIRRNYTLAVAGMLQLANARWLYGCTGRNLDILARQPLWQENLDYKCGTGHGVGYILNVHEGPQGIRWRFNSGSSEAVIEAGMAVTDEPGVYAEGKYGLRIENVLVACNGEKNEYGQFMYFDTLTYAPIDLEAIDVSVFTDAQRQYLNAYHAAVYRNIAPYLEPEERQWLQGVTSAV